MKWSEPIVIFSLLIDEYTIPLSSREAVLSLRSMAEKHQNCIK